MLRSLILLLLLPTHALALSCAAQNFGEDFNRIAEAPELYSILYGSLQSNEAISQAKTSAPREASYTFEGRYIGLRQDQAGELTITAKTSCIKSWCGGLPPVETPVLMYVQHDGAALTLASGACVKDFIVNPSLGQVTAIRACMRAGSCGAEEIGAFSQNR